MDVDQRRADAGHDVRVGHHPVGRVDEAGPLDALVAAVGAADADDVGRRALDVRIGEEAAGARRHGHDPLRRERLEVAREERRADDVVERRELGARLRRQDPVDLGQDLRLLDERGDPPQARARQRDAERPGDEQRGGTAEGSPAHRVERAHRLPGDLVAQPGATHLEERLPERRADDHDEHRGQRDQDRRARITQRRGREPDPDHTADQQTDRREGAGDEALPVAGHGVQHHDHDQHPVEEVHGRSWDGAGGRAGPRVGGGAVVRAPPCSMYPGRSRTTRSSQAWVQPT